MEGHESMNLFTVKSWLFNNQNVFYVTTDNTWCFHWEGNHLANLLNHNQIKLKITPYPWNLKGKVVHFGDRYVFFSKTDEEITQFCKKNSVILTWFHGGPEDGEEFGLMLKRLYRLQNDIPIIHTSCLITREILINSGIVPSKIIVIPIAIDLNIFKQLEAEKKVYRKKLSIPQEAFVIGSFQKDGDGWGDGFSPKMIKGPDIFIELIRTVYPKVPNLTALLTGPARGYVKKGLDEIGVPYIHHYLENYLDIVHYYQTLDLYLITSRAEGGPKALAECWACGVPLLSTKVGMCADLIKNGENGFFIDPNDIDGSGHVLMNMIFDKEIRTHCITNGLETVKELSWESIGHSYLENIYFRLLHTY